MENRRFAEYDEEADVLYVTLLDEDVADTEELGDLRMIDYTADRRIVGVEFVSPSAGIDLADVPLAADVEEVIRNSGFSFRVLA